MDNQLQSDEYSYIDNFSSSDSESDKHNSSEDDYTFYESQNSCVRKLINAVSWLGDVIFLSNNYMSTSITKVVKSRPNPLYSENLNNLDHDQLLFIDCLGNKNLSKQASIRHLSAMMDTQLLPNDSIFTYVQDLDGEKMLILYKYYNTYTKHKSLYSIYENMLKSNHPEDLKLRLQKVRNISKRFVEILPVIYLETLQSSFFDSSKFDQNLLEINSQTMDAISDCHVLTDLLATNSAVASERIEIPIVKSDLNSGSNSNNLPIQSHASHKLDRRFGDVKLPDLA